MGNHTTQLKKLSFVQYRKPVSVKTIPDSQMVSLERSIQKHLDYNEAFRAAGIEAAGNYIAQ